MLGRLMPILSLIATAIVGVVLYRQGVLERIFQPYVVVAVAEADIQPGSEVTRARIEARSIAVDGLVAGALTFPEASSEADIVKALDGQIVSKPVPEGNALTADMIGRASEISILRTIEPIAAGESLTLRNLTSESLSGGMPDGAIAFESEQSAFSFINQSYDLVARSDMGEGTVLSLNAMTSGAEKLFAIQALGEVAAGAAFSIEDLEPISISSRTMPPGTLAFRTAGSAGVFVTSAEDYAASAAIGRGDILSIDKIMTGGAEASDGRFRPETLVELQAYMAAYPGEAIMITEENSLDSGPEPEGRVDLWVEEARTEGAFGTIRLRRIGSDMPLETVARTAAGASGADMSTMPAGAGARSTPGAQDNVVVIGNGPVTEGGAPGSEGEADAREASPDTGLANDRVYWIETPQEVGYRFEEVRRSGGIVFAISSRADLTEALGNGATCAGETCRVDRAKSNDLARVRERVEVSGPQGIALEGGDANPLLLLDGVEADLAARMTAQGYGTLQRVAAWQDAEIPAITFALEISNNLALYIREQARTIVRSPEEARRKLDLDAPPAE